MQNLMFMALLKVASPCSMDFLVLNLLFLKLFRLTYVSIIVRYVCIQFMV